MVGETPGTRSGHSSHREGRSGSLREIHDPFHLGPTQDDMKVGVLAGWVVPLHSHC
jgi:hypothetical protein